MMDCLCDLTNIRKLPSVFLCLFPSSSSSSPSSSSCVKKLIPYLLFFIGTVSKAALGKPLRDGMGAYGHFRVHTYHLKLDGTEYILILLFLLLLRFFFSYSYVRTEYQLSVSRRVRFWNNYLLAPYWHITVDLSKQQLCAINPRTVCCFLTSLLNSIKLTSPVF